MPELTLVEAKVNKFETARKQKALLTLARRYGFEVRTAYVEVDIGPVVPPVKVRPDMAKNLGAIAEALSEVTPDVIYGESLHARGANLRYVEKALGEKVFLDGFDKKAEKYFHDALREHGLQGTWWPER